MKFNPIAVVALLMCVAGCSSAPTLLKLDAPGEQRLSSADIVDVALAPADRSRTDPLLLPFGSVSKLLVETGPIWQRAFRGDERSVAKLVITKAELRQSIGGMGFTTRHTYFVEARVLIGGREYPITADGSRAAAIAVPAAMRQAVELGVAEIARQAAAILDLETKKSR